MNRPILFLLGTLLTIASLAATAHASVYSDAVIADGAINYWRFEEGATSDPAKDSAGSVDGTYSGNILVEQTSASAVLGNAALFDGVDGSHVNLGVGTNIGNSISVEAWVNLDTDATASFSPIVARWDGSFELDVNSTDQPGLGVDRVDFVLRNDSNAFGDPASIVALTRGAWHHVVGVFDGGSGLGSVYLDGVAGDPFNLGGVLQDAGGDDGNWYIGTTRGPASGFNWDGLIDEVAIYDKPLSGATIAEHYSLGQVPEPSTGLLLSLAALGITVWVRRR